jgi:hypothetical protein
VTANDLDQALRALTEMKPYQVFTVVLNGGKRFGVDQPSAVGWRNGVAAYLAPGGAPVFFDHNSVNQIIVAPANTSL